MHFFLTFGLVNKRFSQACCRLTHKQMIPRLTEDNSVFIQQWLLRSTWNKLDQCTSNLDEGHKQVKL